LYEREGAGLGKDEEKEENLKIRDRKFNPYPANVENRVSS
jgi:hypothetical protein